MISILRNIEDAIYGLLHIIEIHATTIQKEHDVRLMKARKALFDIERLIASIEFLFSDMLDKESEKE